jgi:hypothetical protein
VGSNVKERFQVIGIWRNPHMPWKFEMLPVSDCGVIGRGKVAGAEVGGTQAVGAITQLSPVVEVVQPVSVMVTPVPEAG